MDVEGLEYDVLKAWPFDKLRVGAWIVEHNDEEPKRANIIELLKTHGYERCVTAVTMIGLCLRVLFAWRHEDSLLCDPRVWLWCASYLWIIACVCAVTLYRTLAWTTILWILSTGRRSWRIKLGESTRLVRMVADV